jgi:hypothetical protein
VSTEKILDVEVAFWAGVIDKVKRRAAADGRTSVEELTEFAGGALDRYVRMLLAGLLAEYGGIGEPDTDAAIRRRFTEGLDRAGTTLREALAQSRHRHSVSQVLQRKMFEAESMFRKTFKSRAAERTLRSNPAQVIA